MLIQQAILLVQQANMTFCQHAISLAPNVFRACQAISCVFAQKFALRDQFPNERMNFTHNICEAIVFLQHQQQAVSGAYRYGSNSDFQQNEQTVCRSGTYSEPQQPEVSTQFR